MPRFLALFLVLLVGSIHVTAQTETRSQPGDPPLASLISVSPADENGIVTISGAAGAVFPAAQVAIRNLYTEQVVYTQAGITGTFSAQLFGPGNTPFWVSPASAIPNTARNRPGSLPGGPGTIVYGSFPETRQNDNAITQLVLDGDGQDWMAYSQSALSISPRETIYALRNRDSLYMGFSAALAPADQQNLRAIITLDGATYSLTLDPRLEEQTAIWRRLRPNEADLGTVAVAVTQADLIEMRVPLSTLRPVVGAVVNTATIEQILFLRTDGTEQRMYSVGREVPLVDEVDGVVYLDNPLSSGEFVRFTVSGALAQGDQTWNARARINNLNIQPGERQIMQFDVTLNAPDLPPGLVGLDMIGQLWLQPVVDEAGLPVSGGLHSNNGWSGVLTPSGMPIDNLRSDFLVAEARTPAPQVLRRGTQLIFGLSFDFTLPEDLPPGLYVPLFRGQTQVADGEIISWEENSLLGQGTAVPHPVYTRLPVVLNIGEITTSRLIWTLFQDSPSNGSRGILAAEDTGRLALSNRVHYNSPTYILSPDFNGTGEALTYPLEPYIINQMGNRYDMAGAPLLPFLFPGGRISAQVTRPDGTVDNLGTTSIVQNELSTPIEDEGTLFGGQSQVDVYRLTTLNPLFTRYVFDQYGTYAINLTGNIEDVWGNRYEGGGHYEVLVAQLLDLQPAMLPGTPFEVGDTFNAGLVVVPGVAADVTITARLYPLDGSAMIEKTASGTASSGGYFHDPAGNFSFEVPGEYVIDYEARFTDAEGRLWAGSQRMAGVITSPLDTFIAHGRRGLDNYAADWRPAWFNTRQYLPGGIEPRMLFPYHSGDVLWNRDGLSVQPGLSIQDTQGAYENWLLQNLPGYQTVSGMSLREAVVRDALPVVMTGGSGRYPLGFKPDTVVNDAYTYISVVRPGVTVRQYIQGREDGGLLTEWSSNDPANGQVGAGPSGESPGDYLFVFGGTVIRNAEAGVSSTAGYAAFSPVIDNPADTLGPRVYPPFNGEAGGPNGGALLRFNEQPVAMFFHPTSLRPGQLFTVGDTLAVSGHVAPTLPSQVLLTVTGPDGEAMRFAGYANAWGYFYDSAADILLDAPGVWTVEIRVQHDGLTSAGQVYPPLPQGTVLGATGGVFNIYVLPEESVQLDWLETRIDIPIAPGLPFNFNFTLPEEWTNTRAYHTVMIPGYIVADEPLSISGRSFSYQYNLGNLNRRFPTVEIDARLKGAAASDPVILTFVATGQDSAGRLQIHSRSYTIFHDRLLNLQ